MSPSSILALEPQSWRWWNDSPYITKTKTTPNPPSTAFSHRNL